MEPHKVLRLVVNKLKITLNKQLISLAQKLVNKLLARLVNLVRQLVLFLSWLDLLQQVNCLCVNDGELRSRGGLRQFSFEWSTTVAWQLVLLGVIAGLAFLALFLLLPLLAVFTQAFEKGWNTYVSAITNPITLAAVRLTLLTAAIAALSTDQLAATFSSEQFAALATAAVGALKTAQVSALRSDQLAAMFRFGFNWISYGNDDMANYTLAAERFLKNSYYFLPEQTQLEGTDYSQHFWFMHALQQIRPGSELLLSWTCSVTGLNPHQVFMPVIFALSLVQICSLGSLILFRGRFRRLAQR